jgi:hypothetical protein
VSNFVTIPAGDYTGTIAPASGSPLEEAISLENNQVFTAIAYGDGTLNLLLTPTDFSMTQPDSARLKVVNALSDDTVTLVDLGGNQRLDVDGSAIRDVRLVENVGLGTVSDAEIVREGTYNWAFYGTRGEEFVELATLKDWQVKEGTEQLVILTADYDATLDNNGNYRARVLDRNQEALLVNALEQFGSPSDIGNDVFTTYLLPVNLVGFLLLVALIGVIVLTRPAGLTTERRSTINRRRKVSRPLVNVISQQTGRDVVVDVPRLQEPDSDE